MNKPFNKDAALAGAPCVTRDGRLVLEIIHKPESAEGMRLSVKLPTDSGGTATLGYYEDGLYQHSSASRSPLDLFMLGKATVQEWQHLNFPVPWRGKTCLTCKHFSNGWCKWGQKMCCAEAPIATSAPCGPMLEQWGDRDDAKQERAKHDDQGKLWPATGMC